MWNIFLLATRPFWIFFCVIVGGYLIQSYVLIFVFYVLRRGSPTTWKSQPRHDQSLGIFWLPPLLSSKPNRGPHHRLFCTLNLVMAGVFAGFVSEAIYSNKSKLRFVSSPTLLEWCRIVFVELVICVAYESIVEYYWHRAMHLEVFYARLHKFHHYYKAPEVFDDMMIHPIEAFGYYCILYAPPFLFPISCQAFVLYMIVMGLFGVWDHSGVRLTIKGLYDSKEHDLHHEKFVVNFGFPFMIIDKISGTYLAPS